MIFFAPGRTLNQYPAGRNSIASVEEQIEAFYDTYRVWLLEIAEKMADIADSGFAVLLVLNPYFEVIARHYAGVTTKDIKDRKKTGIVQSDLVKKGIKLVFPEIDIHPHLGDTACDELCDALRNNMAHMGLTGSKILLSEDLDCALFIQTNENADKIDKFVINPRKWTQTIRSHFEGYANQLRDPANVEFRQRFSRCFLEMNI